VGISLIKIFQASQETGFETWQFRMTGLPRIIFIEYDAVIVKNDLGSP
jgi:hypothetical protein